MTGAGRGSASVAPVVIGEGEVEAVEDIDARADEALDRFLPHDDRGGRGRPTT